MQATVPVIKVVSRETPQGFVIINASEFDATKHEVFGGGDADAAVETPQAAPAVAVPAAPVGPLVPVLDTVKVQSDDTSQGFIIINASSFDPKTQKLFVETDAPKTEAPAQAATPAATPAANASAQTPASGEGQASSAGTIAGMKANEAFEAIKLISDVEFLTAALAAETRVTVQRSLAERIAELTGK